MHGSQPQAGAEQKDSRAGQSVSEAADPLGAPGESPGLGPLSSFRCSADEEGCSPRLPEAPGKGDGAHLRADDLQRQQPGNTPAPQELPRQRHRVLSLLQEQCRAISVKQRGVKRARTHEDEAWRTPLAASPSFGGAGQGTPLGRDPAPSRPLGARPGLPLEQQVAPHQASQLIAGSAGGEGLSLGLPLGHGGSRPPAGSLATRLRGAAAIGRRPAEAVDSQRGAGAALPEGPALKAPDESPEVSLEAGGGGIKLEAVSLAAEAAAGQRDKEASQWTGSNRPGDLPMLHVLTVPKPEVPLDWQGKDYARQKSEEQESNTDEVSTGSENAPGGTSIVLAHSRASSPPRWATEGPGREERESPDSIPEVASSAAAAGMLLLGGRGRGAGLGKRPLGAPRADRGADQRPPIGQARSTLDLRSLLSKHTADLSRKRSLGKLGEASGAQLRGALADVDSSDVATRGKPSATAAAACLKLMASLDSRRSVGGGGSKTHAGTEEGSEHSAQDGGSGRPAKAPRLRPGSGPCGAESRQGEMPGAALAGGAGPIAGCSDARQGMGTPQGDSLHAGLVHAPSPEDSMATLGQVQAPPAVSLKREPGSEGPEEKLKGSCAEGAGNSTRRCKDEPGIRTSTETAASGDSSHTEPFSAQAGEEAPARAAALATIRESSGDSGLEAQVSTAPSTASTRLDSNALLALRQLSRAGSLSSGRAVGAGHGRGPARKPVIGEPAFPHTQGLRRLQQLVPVMPGGLHRLQELVARKGQRLATPELDPLKVQGAGGPARPSLLPKLRGAVRGEMGPREDATDGAGAGVRGVCGSSSNGDPSCVKGVKEEPGDIVLGSVG